MDYEERGFLPYTLAMIDTRNTDMGGVCFGTFKRKA